MIKIVRLFREKWRDPIIRRNALHLLAGKTIGLAILAILISKWYLPGQAYADATPPVIPPHINAINTVWTLVAAYLVFCMQVGFVMLEAGFARSREVGQYPGRRYRRYLHLRRYLLVMGIRVYVLPRNAMDRYYRLHAAWTGRHLRHDRRAPVGLLGFPVRLRGHLFDDYFGCDDRALRFYRRYPLQHRRDWFHLSDHRALGMGPGRLAGDHGPIPFHDFAGSTVVHTIGGVISLAGAIALGPRLGRIFKRDGGEPMKPHDLIIGATGGLILWFGWYGFNPGAPCPRSTCKVSDAFPLIRHSRPAPPD